MLVRFICAAIFSGLALGIVHGQSNSGAGETLNRTSPANGKQMFDNYCASCHGLDAKGHGPAAPALKTPPTDLTGLSRSNHGEFPEAHVIAVLQYGTTIPSHGAAEMPVWGPILGKMDKVSPQVQKLRVSNLVRYLETLQSR